MTPSASSAPATRTRVQTNEQRRTVRSALRNNTALLIVALVGCPLLNAALHLALTWLSGASLSWWVSALVTGAAGGAFGFVGAVLGAQRKRLKAAQPAAA